MEPKEVFDELKTILVTRLKFDPRRAVDLTLETTLPKGIESSIGLDSLDFIELSIAIEEALRDRDGRVGGPRPPLHLLRHAVPLHRVEDARRVRPVAVTGLGVVSPFGAGVKPYWEGLTGGICGIRPLTLIDTDASAAGSAPRSRTRSAARSGGRGRSLRPRRRARGARRRRDRPRGSRGHRADRGRGRGGMLEAEAWYWQRARGAVAPPPRVLASCFPSSHVDVVGSVLGIGGPRETVVTACSSGAASLAMAADLIADGVVSVASPRRRRADADLLHGIQHAEAPRSVAVPSLRP